jgi:hypothetical protein
LTLGLAGTSSSQRAREVGAGIVRIDVGWPAAQRPAEPTNPADPAYDWARADREVDAARAEGMDVLVSFTGLPRWAQRAHVPRAYKGATYRPRASDIGGYGHALAAHFAGRVRAFQVWNRPNRSDHLTPQRSAASTYRAMLNAFYAGVKRADPSAIVVTAGTASTGAVDFWRQVLDRPAPFDVLAQEPSSVLGPTHHAPAGDVAFPDLGRLRRLLEHAHKRARLWVTRASFGAGHALWLEHAFELLWRAGADTVIWSDIPDQASATAFRFPFVAGGDQVWTRAPADGVLEVQRNGRTVQSTRVTSGQVLLLHGISTRRGDVFRGVVARLRSLPWRATH